MGKRPKRNDSAMVSYINFLPGRSSAGADLQSPPTHVPQIIHKPNQTQQLPPPHNLQAPRTTSRTLKNAQRIFLGARERVSGVGNSPRKMTSHQYALLAKRYGVVFRFSCFCQL